MKLKRGIIIIKDPKLKVRLKEKEKQRKIGIEESSRILNKGW